MRAQRRHSQPGQSLLEFALVAGLFLMLTIGAIDGLRVIFYYSQVQESARMGARWGAVQVARSYAGEPGVTPYGTFAAQGNAVGSYCSTGCSYPLQGSQTFGTGPLTPTVVGAALNASTGMSPSLTDITINTSIAPTATEDLQTESNMTNMPVSVTVTYSFQPIIGLLFGGMTIPLQGTSTMLHE